MSDLHTEGWRQGSIVSRELTATHLTFAESRIQQVSRSHGQWVVCTQEAASRRVVGFEVSVGVHL